MIRKSDKYLPPKIEVVGISAEISTDVKKKLDELVSQSGHTKRKVIEAAINLLFDDRQQIKK